MTTARFAFAALLSAAAALAAPLPRLDMTAFFSGRTRAENMIKVAFHAPTPLIVDSVGSSDGKEFVMVDTVHEGDKPVRQRKWVMRPAGPNHFRGTLTDAVGPVDILVSGNSAVIRYTMKGGLKIEQLLELQRDGRTLANHVVARKFGLKFASVEGTVRKLD